MGQEVAKGFIILSFRALRDTLLKENSDISEGKISCTTERKTHTHNNLGISALYLRLQSQNCTASGTMDGISITIRMQETGPANRVGGEKEQSKNCSGNRNRFILFSYKYFKKWPHSIFLNLNCSYLPCRCNRDEMLHYCQMFSNQ